MHCLMLLLWVERMMTELAGSLVEEDQVDEELRDTDEEMGLNANRLEVE